MPTDRLVNQLVPHYLPGRKYILFIQSLVYPLKTLNDRFVSFAGEKQIEASMTSQVMYFEWYLNHKFKKYLRDKRGNILITESGTAGVDIYHEGAQYCRPFTLWYNTEQPGTAKSEEQPRPLYHTSEEKAVNKAGFIICVPEITAPEKEFACMLSHVVNTYKPAGKSYLIKIDSKETEPEIKPGQ